MWAGVVLMNVVVAVLLDEFLLAIKQQQSEAMDLVQSVDYTTGECE